MSAFTDFELVQVAFAWLLTYTIHGTVLLALAWDREPRAGRACRRHRGSGSGRPPWWVRSPPPHSKWALGGPLAGRWALAGAPTEESVSQATLVTAHLEYAAPIEPSALAPAAALPVAAAPAARRSRHSHRRASPRQARRTVLPGAPGSSLCGR